MWTRNTRLQIFGGVFYKSVQYLCDLFRLLHQQRYNDYYTGLRVRRI